MKFEVDDREYRIEDVIVCAVVKRTLVDYLVLKNEGYHSMLPVPKYSELSEYIANDLSASDTLKIGKELSLVLDELGEKVLIITPYNSIVLPNEKYLRRQKIDIEELINKTKEVLNGKSLTLK